MCTTLEDLQPIIESQVDHTRNQRVKKFLTSIENENTTYQNLWNKIKAHLRGNFRAANLCIK